MTGNFDNLLERLIASTRSPRGRYSKEQTWPLLQNRLRGQRLRRTGWRSLARAAAVALLCLIGWQIYEMTRPAEWIEVTAQAETRTVILPDRTEVTLNRYSSLSYPKDLERREKRDVQLTGGASFSVTHDPAHPFVVKAEGVQVQVLGTRFNVEAYPRDEEVRATLLQGAVAVNASGQHLTLTPGERAIYHKAKGILTQQPFADPTGETDWSRGVLNFREQPLQEIIRRIENAYQVDIRLTDTTLADYRLTARFDADEPLTDILATLASAAGFRYRQDHQTIILYN